MQRNVLEYLDAAAQRFAEKMAFDDNRVSVTFKELKENADIIGSGLLHLAETRSPIAVYLPKGSECISAFMGIVASGNFYCPIDITMPAERVRTILNTLMPAAVITKKGYAEKVELIYSQCKIIIWEEITKETIYTEGLEEVRKKMCDTDPLYVLFTSGSTGIPKGVTISHRSVIDYIDWVGKTFQINESDIFGNQAPFYFDNSILDIYCALKYGSSVYIIPKKKFLFPKDLMEYLNEKQINIIFWVPSMLCMVANLKGLEACRPKYLKKILFCGEVMPNKQLNIWRKELPDALYANLYGPTEITDVCTYYVVDREFQDDDLLPIGRPCENTRIYVLNEKDEQVCDGESGELCVAGSCLALGYYNNVQKTLEAFIQNPVNNRYEEKIYRTGDIVKYNEKGELLFLSRKDFQIKHMGHRIELGEIEAACEGVEQIENCVCSYDSQNSRIVMFYIGREIDAKDVGAYLKKKIPEYMIPNDFIRCTAFPYNANGKIDRKELTNSYLAGGCL